MSICFWKLKNAKGLLICTISLDLMMISISWQSFAYLTCNMRLNLNRNQDNTLKRMRSDKLFHNSFNPYSSSILIQWCTSSWNHRISLFEVFHLFSYAWPALISLLIYQLAMNKEETFRNNLRFLQAQKVSFPSISWKVKL